MANLVLILTTTSIMFAATYFPLLCLLWANILSGNNMNITEIQELRNTLGLHIQDLTGVEVRLMFLCAQRLFIQDA